MTLNSYLDSPKKCEINMKYPCIVIILILSQITHAQKLVKVWETDAILSGPESVAYDPVRNVLYASNLRKTEARDTFYGDDFISRVSLTGDVIDLRWIENVTEPTGISIHNDKLYIVERFGVVIYDLKTDEIERKVRINTQRFINDIAVDPTGTVYVSESDTDNIYSINGGVVTIWYAGNAISRTNGILFDSGKLIVGVNADSTLKAIDVKTKTMTTLAQLKKGIIDGIKPIGDDYLVSFFEGNLFRVTKNGNVTELLNSRGLHNIADFEYIESKNLLVVPALWQHKIIGYKLE